MNHYKAIIIFISERGQKKNIAIEFIHSENRISEHIEYFAISLGYPQLITEGLNQTPDDQDYFFFEKIKSLQMA